MRSLILMLALMLVAGVAFAQDAGTTCVPAPGTTTTTTTTGSTTMSSGTMTTVAMSPQVETFNTNFVSQTYNISRSDIADLRTRHDWGTVYFIANMSARTGRPVTEIASLADQGMSWDQIATRYNVAMADLTTPYPTTRVAGFTGEVGVMPMNRTWISDRYGNVVLTEREDRRLKKMGYTWEEIAVAANVSAQTGEPVYSVLQWTDRGLTWNQVARQYGLDSEDIMNTSNYPFSRNGQVMMTTQPIGAGPSTTVESTSQGTLCVPSNTPSTAPSTTPGPSY